MNILIKILHLPKFCLMWSLYYLIQQKLVGHYSPFNRNMWKKTSGDRNYPKQHKSVELLLLWSQFASSKRNPAHDNRS